MKLCPFYPLAGNFSDNILTNVSVIQHPEKKGIYFAGGWRLIEGTSGKRRFYDFLISQVDC